MLCYKGSNLNYFQFGGNSAKRFCNKVQNLSCNSSCGDQSCDLFFVPIFFGRYLHFHFHSFLVIAMNSRIFVAILLVVISPVICLLFRSFIWQYLHFHFHSFGNCDELLNFRPNSSFGRNLWRHRVALPPNHLPDEILNKTE